MDSRPISHQERERRRERGGQIKMKFRSARESRDMHPGSISLLYSKISKTKFTDCRFNVWFMLESIRLGVFGSI